MYKITLTSIILTAVLTLCSIIPSKAQITVLSPNGGEVWNDGAPSLVSWNNEGFENWHVIEFSPDNGITWYEFLYAYSFPGVNESYISFTNGATSEAKIRVKVADSPDIFDESDSTFSVIVPAYVINKPIAGEMYYQSEEIYVQWYSVSNNPVNLDFSSDNGVTWSRVGSSVNSYYYGFGAPLVVSDECKVRLTDATDSTFTSTSNAFSVSEAPSIQLTSPNGGEIWEYGQNYTVSWSGENLDDYIAIELSLDGGNNWQLYWYGESELTGGSMEITPPQVNSNNARIRVSLYYYPQYSDASDAGFTINSPAYLIYYPYASSVWYAGKDILVQWVSGDYQNTKLELSTDNGNTFQTILPNIPAYEQYAYIQAPDQPSDSCLIRLSVVGNPELSSVSELFRVIAIPELEITFPAGGEVLDNDSTYFIKWDLTGEVLDYTYLNIEYSNDNGITWNFAGWVSDLLTTDSAYWRTPSELSDQCLIRMRDDYDIINSQSQSVFSIKDLPSVKICMVSVDSVSGKNMVVWNKVASDLIDEYVILKEGNVTNQYTEIGSVDKDAVSLFIDQNSNPEEKATRYKLTFRDSQGNLYGTGSFHQTIHLSINKGVGNTWNLYWNGYLGFPVLSYNIYRGTEPGNMALIGTVSGNFTSFTDQNAPAGFIYYMIEVLNPDVCVPAGSRSSDFGSTKSNIATNKTLGIESQEDMQSLLVYPNPAGELIKIKAVTDLKKEIQVMILSSAGSVISEFTTNGISLSNGIEYNISNLPRGLYSIILSGEQNSTSTRFIKQ